MRQAHEFEMHNLAKNLHNQCLVFGQLDQEGKVVAEYGDLEQKEFQRLVR